MKAEIRQAIALSPELEDSIFNLRDQAYTLLQKNDLHKAEAAIQEAWNLLPEPKFNTSCSYIILTSLYPILIRKGKYEAAKLVLTDWITDLETCGYRIFETTPYILLGEIHLHLDEIEDTKQQFYKAVKLGASKRDFAEKPAFYFEIAKKKIMDNNEIKSLFEKQTLAPPPTSLPAQELTDEIIDQIDELCEKGNEYSDNEKYAEAIKVWAKALALIPSPQNSFSQSQWLETSIGDAWFLLDDFKKALQHFENAKTNLEENAYQNPFIMLRLGQTYLENKQHTEAKEFLLRAYMLEGESIFDNDDEKYFNYLKQHVELM